MVCVKDTVKDLFVRLCINQAMRERGRPVRSGPAAHIGLWEMQFCLPVPSKKLCSPAKWQEASPAL